MSYNNELINVNKRDLLNKLLNKFHRSYVIRSFSVGQKDLPILALFDELVQREKAKFSELVVRALEEYVRRHHPGNPQLPLTRFTVAEAQVTISKPAKMDPKKEKAREMLAFAIEHVDKLPPHSREYYSRLAQENQDLEEALQLIKLLSEKDTTEG